jgi:hypothetical protein
LINDCAKKVHNTTNIDFLFKQILFGNTVLLAVDTPIAMPMPILDAGRDVDAIFERVLNGEDFKAIGIQYKLSITTIAQLFWKRATLLQYINGDIPYSKYYGDACGRSAVKSICSLDDIRANKKHWQGYLDAYAMRVISKQSLLVMLDIHARYLNILVEAGIETVAQYLENQGTYSIAGISKKSFEDIDYKIYKFVVKDV